MVKFFKVGDEVKRNILLALFGALLMMRKAEIKGISF